MKYLSGVLLLLLCCTSARETILENPPELLETTPLPPLPRWFQQSELIFEVRIHVAPDGHVIAVDWGSKVIDREWDAVAEQEIRKWRFSPMTVDGRPFSPWIQQKVRVLLDRPSQLVLGQITLRSGAAADSVFSLLDGGADFEDVARELSVDSFAVFGGYRGETDIRFFPPKIQEGLLHLRVGDMLGPFRMGEKFVILKRVGKRIPNG